MAAKREVMDAIAVTKVLYETFAAVAAVTANSWEAFAFWEAYWAKFIEVWAYVMAIDEKFDVELAEADILNELESMPY